MRLGVFGGTFDPVHLGHLILAEQCREQARLDKVLFIPAARPPHKPDQPITPFEKRAEMLALAVAGYPAFQVDDLEKDRPGPSYTVDTLDELQGRFPSDHLFLLVGSDVLPDLVHWREPARIGALAELLVVGRLGWAMAGPEASAIQTQLPPEIRLTQVVESPLIEISSRDLRRRVSQGRSIRYQVPHAVEAYIRAHRLYQ